jgi:hypothetical protein
MAAVAKLFCSLKSWCSFWSFTSPHLPCGSPNRIYSANKAKRIALTATIWGKEIWRLEASYSSERRYRFLTCLAKQT